jgi:hypothetical protein
MLYSDKSLLYFFSFFELVGLCLAAYGYRYDHFSKIFEDFNHLIMEKV